MIVTVDRRENRLFDRRGVADSKIGDQLVRGISGGERRRVSIGMELVTQPSVLFLDEPTSGLDSWTALEIVKIISKLAKNGRCVVLSIHQPSSSIYSIIDDYVFLAKGKLVYGGAREHLLPFFEHAGHPVPAGVNPADFVVDVITEYQKNREEKALADKYEKYATAQHLIKEPAHGELEPIKGEYARSIIREISVLTKVGFLNAIRTKELYALRVALFLFTSVVMGSLFLQVDDTYQGVKEVISYLVFICCHTFFTSVESLPIYFKYRDVFIREYGNGYYSLASHVIADTIVSIPIALTCALFFSFAGYWMVGLNPLARYYFYSIFIQFIMLFSSAAFCTFLSAVVPDPTMGISMGVSMYAAMFVFSGFFVKRSAIPDWWIWMHYLSHFKWALDELATNHFQDNVGPYNMCKGAPSYGQNSSDTSCYSTSAEVLDFLSMDGFHKGSGIGVLLAFFCLWKFLYVLVLWKKGAKSA